MSRLRRFRHLEGKRPDRSAGAPSEHLLASQTTVQSAIACALCGAPLADEASACARCTGRASPRGDFATPADPASTGAAVLDGSRADRFRNLGGDGSIPLGREVEARTDGAEIAATVPAWRGEALSPEVAADVRRKLGIPEQQELQREDLLGWAQRQLERKSTRDLLLVLGAGYFGRRLIGNLIGGVAAILILIFFVFHRACS